MKHLYHSSPTAILLLPMVTHRVHSVAMHVISYAWIHQVLEDMKCSGRQFSVAE